MDSGHNDADEATSRRVEGPTPKGGAYSIGYFSHDGRPVPQRFANQILIIEYDDDGREIYRTFGLCTPKVVLPPEYVPPSASPEPPGAGPDLLSFGAALGGTRAKPRPQPIAEGPQ
jgi:hypothetical protein